jgi:hypothetical protein
MTTYLRVIEGGKPNAAQTRPRLFKAYSVSDLMRDERIYHNVRFNWYRLERDRPMAPYRDLIADYDKLDEMTRHTLEADVNRYLTEEEIRALQDYLMGQYNLPVFVNEVSLPVKEVGCFQSRRNVLVYDFLELSEEEGYFLPFKVWGYYSLTHCLSSPSLEKGMYFLHRALEYMGMDNAVENARLKAVVKSIYEDEGLYVTRDDA